MEAAPSHGEVSFIELVSSERSLITSGVVARREPHLKLDSSRSPLRHAQDFRSLVCAWRDAVRASLIRTGAACDTAREGPLVRRCINSHKRELASSTKIRAVVPLSLPHARPSRGNSYRRCHCSLLQLGKLHWLRVFRARTRIVCRASNWRRVGKRKQPLAAAAFVRSLMKGLTPVASGDSKKMQIAMGKCPAF